MLSYPQAILMGLMQGVTELFPVSSLGHSVILPHILGWSINERQGYFLTFLVATHFATALVLVGFFWRDWLRIVRGILTSLRDRAIVSSEARLGWFLVIGTIPAGILGLIFQDNLQALFAQASFAAAFLAANGLLLLSAEFLRRRAPKADESDSDIRIVNLLTWPKALGVGALQSLALLPGFSRTGAALSGGLLVGLSHQDAARFAFFLATPIIVAAAVLKLPELGSSGENIIGPILVGAGCSAVAAYLSVKFLTRYFKTKTLTPFAIYCLLIGSGLLIYFWAS